MQIVENTLDTSLGAVLDEPVFCFFAHGSVEENAPRISPLWFLWEDEHIWIIADSRKSYYARVEADGRAAVAVVDFDVYTGRVRHIGMRGNAAIVAMDLDLADRLLSKYLGPNKEIWDDRFVDIDPDRWHLIRFRPSTVVARDQSFEPTLPSTSPDV